MRNKKLHLINELLNEFDTARTTNDIDRLVSGLDALNERIVNISHSYTKDHVFTSILDFISIEIHITIESELVKLNTGEVA